MYNVSRLFTNDVRIRVTTYKGKVMLLFEMLCC